jgi:ribosomal protein L39E
MPDCPSFTTCSAPLCPLFSTNGEIWFCDESICHKRGIQAEHKVLKVQKKLAKYTKQNGDIGYFDMAMLGKMRRITHKTVGCDPDRPGKKFRGE